MPLLSWDIRFSVHLEAMDDDHRQLFSLLNDLWLTVERGAATNVISRSLSETAQAMREHFEREEALLREIGYPRQQQHARQHRGLLDRLESLKLQIERGKTRGLDVSTLDFIGDWLGKHILSEDMHYAEFNENRQGIGLPTRPSGLRAQVTTRRRTVAKQLAILIGTGLVISSLLFLVILRTERAIVESRFIELAGQKIGAVQGHVAIAEDTVSMLAGHFALAAQGKPDQEGFLQVTAPTVARQKFVQALEWIPMVADRDRQKIESLVKDNGFPGFKFTERTATGKIDAAARRETYFPVIHVAPVSGNEAALGYDLGSNQTRLEALLKARDSGELVATARISLLEEKGDQYGVLLFAPVYGRGKQDDLLARRASLTGFVLGVFRIGDLIAHSTASDIQWPWSPISTAGDLIAHSTASDIREKSKMADSSIDIHVMDMSAPENARQLFPKSPEIDPNKLTKKLTASAFIYFGDRKWLVLATPNAGFENPLLPTNALVALLAGLIATAFAAIFYKGNFDRVESATRFAREISHSKQLLGEAHRVAKLGFIEFDAETSRWICGEGASEMLGLPSDFMGGAFDEVFVNVDPGDQSWLLAEHDGSPAGGLDLDLHVGNRVVHALGKPSDQTNPRSRHLITFQDITHRRQAEQEREALIERMSEASRLESLGTLAGGIAHEINTPAQYIADNLAFIKDWLDRLLDLIGEARATEKTADWIGFAEKVKGFRYEFAARELPAATDQSLAGIARISEIVNAVKDFAYPSGKNPQPFDINKVVEVAAKITHNQWKYVAALELDLATDLPLLVGLEGEISQILVNLIVNAAQAIAELGSPDLGRIILVTRFVGGCIELTVTDSGPGIAEENLGKLFELFFTTKPPGQGTGQGLAISKAIAVRHGGNITVSSNPGQGACFLVRLPVEKPDLPSSGGAS